MSFQFHLPSQSCYKVLKGLAASGIGQNGILIFLSFSDVNDGNFVRFPAFLQGHGKNCQNFHSSTIVEVHHLVVQILELP